MCRWLQSLSLNINLNFKWFTGHKNQFMQIIRSNTNHNHWCGCFHSLPSNNSIFNFILFRCCPLLSTRKIFEMRCVVLCDRFVFGLWFLCNKTPIIAYAFVSWIRVLTPQPGKSYFSKRTRRMQRLEFVSDNWLQFVARFSFGSGSGNAQTIHNGRKEMLEQVDSAFFSFDHLLSSSFFRILFSLFAIANVLFYFSVGERFHQSHGKWQKFAVTHMHSKNKNGK